MSILRLLGSMFLIGTLGALLVPPLNADPIKKRTEVIFRDPFEIPGKVLPAGTYVMKVPDPVTHPDMVGFYNEDESYLYKLVRTIPRYRLDATDKTVLSFAERAHGAPPAVKIWFYPGDNWGREFLYGKVKAVTVAEAAPTPAPPAPAPVEAAPAPAPAPAPQAVAEAPQAPVEIAQATPLPGPGPATPPEAVPEELPKTASSIPLIGLLGACSLALGLLLRRQRSHA